MCVSDVSKPTTPAKATPAKTAPPKMPPPPSKHGDEYMAPMSVEEEEAHVAQHDDEDAQREWERDRVHQLDVVRYAVLRSAAAAIGLREGQRQAQALQIAAVTAV